MIRYAISREELYERVRQIAPDWFSEQRRASLSWGVVRSVYEKLQCNKCAYCERRLPDPNLGADERPIDHFRPKARVREWKEGHEKFGPTGGSSDSGYARLEFEPLNYALACPSCNSSLKRDHFPITGERRTESGDLEELQQELPLLIYPISDLDDDPEMLIEFDGFNPRPCGITDHARLRAEITIEFFGLGAEARSELVELRCKQIDDVYQAWLAGDVETITCETSSAAWQANCTRSFLRLCTSNPERAARVHALAKMWLINHKSSLLLLSERG